MLIFISQIMGIFILCEETELPLFRVYDACVCGCRNLKKISVYRFYVWVSLFTHSLQAAHQAETPALKDSILHGLIISSLIINNYNINSKQNKHFCLEQ